MTHDFIKDTPALEGAINALERWFQSQDMSPQDAGLVINAAMAKWIVSKTKDPEDLKRAVISSSAALGVEILRYCGIKM